MHTIEQQQNATHPVDAPSIALAYVRIIGCGRIKSPV